MAGMRPSAILVLLALGACGTQGDARSPLDRARSAFDAGRYVEAEQLYAEVIEAQSPLALRVEHLQALAHVDAHRAWDRIRDLADQLQPRDIRRLGRELLDADALDLGLDVLHRGKVAFPDDEPMQRFHDRVVDHLRRDGAGHVVWLHDHRCY